MRCGILFLFPITAFAKDGDLLIVTTVGVVLIPITFFLLAIIGWYIKRDIAKTDEELKKHAEQITEIVADMAEVRSIKSTVENQSDKIDKILEKVEKIDKEGYGLSIRLKALEDS